VLRSLTYFGVRRVEVHGARYFRPEEVVQRLGLSERAGVFEDLGELERRLGASRGVERARVSRRLPGTLVVRVTESEPVALARGADGLVPLGRDGGPLPFDPSVSPVDAPLVDAPGRELAAALEAVRLADRGLFLAVSAAALRPEGLVLEVNGGRVLLDVPVNPDSVIRVAATRRELAARGRPWRELDGRFGSWVVARPA
jgi:cell division septal protein FtsQ